jgi:uncharacterized membrane protein
MPLADLQLLFDPAPPWSIPAIGPIALALIATALVALTLWTYRGSPVPNHRKGTVVALRLLALLIAIFTVIRPTFAVTDEDKSPSTLIIISDCSKSMTVADEVDNKSRWDTLQRMLASCTSMLNRLRDEHNITVKTHRFAEELFDDERGPDGSRTDFGQMLHSVVQRYGQEPRLRGLLVLSDGADNGARYPALGEAARLRALNCPVSTFALGRESTSAQQRDLAIVAANIDPSPVAIKGKLAVRTLIDAPGLADAHVTLRLYFDDKPIMTKEATLTKEAGNEVTLEAAAPATPGEIKVTVKVDPRPGEASIANNELTTYLTVTKEGISILLVDRLRPERIILLHALTGDPRFSVFEAVRQTDDPLRGNAAELYNFDRRAYDVIVIGDVSAQRFCGGDKSILGKVEELVRVKGAGLVMLGGQETYATGGWLGTPVADALPVMLESTAQVEEPVQMLPAPTARGDFLMRIGADAASSEVLWRKLPSLPGYTRLGRRKDGAAVIAESATGIPLLVRQNYGKGRTAAFALDETWRWQQLGQTRQPRTTEGIDAHAKFWRQFMLYLAQQEETEGNVWVKPDVRRIPVGGKVNFSVGVRGKTGLDLADGKYEVQIISPAGPLPDPITVTRTGDADRGTFWKTDQPGEYRMVVKGSAKDADGSIINGEATARFLAFQDDTELLRPAANHDFLSRLAQTGGGTFHMADELHRFLEQLPTAGTGNAAPKLKYIPDWRSASLGVFPPLLFVLFVSLLGFEWGLRRWWGMV